MSPEPTSERCWAINVWNINFEWTVPLRHLVSRLEISWGGSIARPPLYLMWHSMRTHTTKRDTALRPRQVHPYFKLFWFEPKVGLFMEVVRFVHLSWLFPASGQCDIMQFFFSPWPLSWSEFSCRRMWLRKRPVNKALKCRTPERKTLKCKVSKYMDGNQTAETCWCMNALEKKKETPS